MSSLTEKERSALDEMFLSLHPSPLLRWRDVCDRYVGSVGTKVSPLFKEKKWAKYFQSKNPSKN